MGNKTSIDCWPTSSYYTYMWSQAYSDCLAYIDSYWDKIIYKPSRMTTSGRVALYLPHFMQGKRTPNHKSIEIPNAYIVPNDRKFNYIFYWDTYFMFRGLMGTRREWILKEMVNNFTYLFDQYGIIPNFNAPVSLGRSQPPFLTSMILDTYNGIVKRHTNKLHEKVFSQYLMGKGREWLKQAMDVAKKEYELVWIDGQNIYNHHVEGYELSRYGDRDVGYAHSSELESGWDFTSRFYNRCNHFLPIDLNTLLYKYECDFAYVAQLFNDKNGETYWLAKAQARKLAINKLLWNEKAGFFYDYGWYYKKQSEFLSLAGFIPLWAGLATHEQAKKMVKKLAMFESRYGLTITAKESLAKPIDLSKIQKRYHPAIEEIIQPKQWDYPNIWSPLEYLTVVGLLKYGFVEEAKQVMESSVKAHSALFRKYGTFFEKINAETGEPGVHFHYENQTGFGWTNAVFYRYIQILDILDAGQELYKQPTPQYPPFELSILH